MKRGHPHVGFRSGLCVRVGEVREVSFERKIHSHFLLSFRIGLMIRFKSGGPLALTPAGRLNLKIGSLLLLEKPKAPAGVSYQ